MEKVKIRKCEEGMDGKAHLVEFADGRKATAWHDKVDCGLLVQACNSMDEIEVELKPYTSKVGKTGLNIIAVNYKGTTITSENPSLQTIHDAKQGNASANGQYQKATFGLNAKRIEMPKPEDFGEADITSINAKSSVKIKKNSKGIGWEIKVVTGEIDLIDDLGRAALKAHRDMSKEFPVETIHIV